MFLLMFMDHGEHVLEASPLVRLTQRGSYPWREWPKGITHDIWIIDGWILCLMDWLSKQDSSHVIDGLKIFLCMLF